MNDTGYLEMGYKSELTIIIRAVSNSKHRSTEFTAYLLNMAFEKLINNLI